MRILLDTSAYSAFKRGQPQIIAALREASFIGLNTIVLGELLSGFARVNREEQNRRELREFLASPRVRIISMGLETAERFAIIYRALYDVGRPVPTHDLWIAASAMEHAMEHGLRVLTTDSHFRRIGMIDTEYVSIATPESRAVDP